MKIDLHRYVYLFPLLFGLICLTAAFAGLLGSVEREAMATQQTVNSPGSLIFKSEDRGESWTAVGSLPDVLTLTPDPAVVGTLYAGSSFGLYKSVNGGATWTLSANGLPREQVNTIVVDPSKANVVYVGTTSVFSNTGAVYKSVDGAASWGPGKLYTGALSVNALSLSPSNSNTIFAATYRGMFKSVDGGENWVEINNGLINTGIISRVPFTIPTVAIDPSNPNLIYAPTLPIISGPPVVCRSADGGNSWDVINNEFGVFYSLVIDPSNTSNLYGGLNGLRSGFGYDSGIFKSTDRGRSWQRVLPDPSSGVSGLDSSLAKLAIDPVTPSTIYAGVNNSLFLSGGEIIKQPRLKRGFYKSVDSGVSWSQKTKGLPDAGITALAVDPQNPSRIYAASAALSASVSAASFKGDGLARESIVAMFGSGFTNSTEGATSTPLPYSLAGVSIKVSRQNAPLFYASPFQVNYQIPVGSIPGVNTVMVSRGGEVISFDTVLITDVAPGLFTADASGGGVVAGVALRARPDGSQIYEPIVNFDQAQNRFVTIPIDLGPESDQVFLSLFGTGIRFRFSESTVKVTIGGMEVPVTFAGPQGTLAALDQINVRLLRTLAGKGEVDLVVTVDGNVANTTRINIK